MKKLHKFFEKVIYGEIQIKQKYQFYLRKIFLQFRFCGNNTIKERFNREKFSEFKFFFYFLLAMKLNKIYFLFF